MQPDCIVEILVIASSNEGGKESYRYPLPYGNIALEAALQKLIEQFDIPPDIPSCSLIKLKVQAKQSIKLVLI